MNDLFKIIKATNSFDDKEISIQDWVEIVLGKEYKNMYSDEYCRRAEKFFSIFIEGLDKQSLDSVDNDILKGIEEARAELKRERYKAQQEKNQLAENYRWQARNELFQERIINAIKNLTPINCQNNIDNFYSVEKENTALLCLSDFHAGSTFEIKGMYGEIINKYDFDIMKERMYYLLNKIVEDDMEYNNMVVAVLGDAFENILRMSSLTKLREPVIDTVIKFSEFFAQWLAELQNNIKVPIKVVCVGGNHDVQRLLGEKPKLEEENLMKIVVEFLKLRLEKFSNIVVRDYTDAAIENIEGINILFNHGEDKDLKTTIDYFENLYRVNIDEVYAGHFHHPENKTIGIAEYGDRQVNRVGSISGLDPYSKQMRFAARPSVYMALYSKGEKGWNKTIYLKERRGNSL